MADAEMDGPGRTAAQDAEERVHAGRALRTVQADLQLPKTDSGEVRNSREVIALAVRLAAALQPGFAPARTRQEVERLDDVDYMGGSLSRRVFGLGDEARGVAVTETVSDANDGMTPAYHRTETQVYGLPEGWALALSAPLFGAIATHLEGTLPDAAVRTVTRILQAEFGATVAVA